jgi:hypothetical protein
VLKRLDPELSRSSSGPRNGADKAIEAINTIVLRLILPPLLAAAALACGSLRHSSDPRILWAAPRHTAADSALAARGREEYRRAGYDARRNFVSPYVATGDFLHYGVTRRFRPGPRIRLDALGLPMVRYDTAYYYNPITMAQFGLAAHGRWLTSHAEPDSAAFIRASEALLAMVSDDGALRYPFPFSFYFLDRVIPAGWVSGMAQGQALSLFTRAYAATHDPRYLAAGRLVLEFLTVPIEAGGPASSMHALDPSLRRFPTYELFPATPPSYTLNGFLFTLLGLYDWSVIEPLPVHRDQARRLFERALPTAERILPLYDIGGFSVYDLAFLTYDTPPHVIARYHAVHIYLLHALHAVSSSPVLKMFECRWLDEAQGRGACNSSH